VGEVDAKLEQEEEYVFLLLLLLGVHSRSAIFEENNGNSLRSIAVVSVCLRLDGARLTRVTLGAVAEVVAMGKGEGYML
jgi:hypothetical protein